MSVVVAIKKDNKVYLGADSQVTKGGTRNTLKNEHNYKIWKVYNTNNCLMAHVGVVRDANIIRTMDSLVTDVDLMRNRISYDFVVRYIVPRLIGELKDYGYVKRDDYFSSMESCFLFAFEDQLYSISSDGCVIEVDDYVAIGSGEDQAIGSLLSTEGEDPKTRIVKAIKSSAASDIYVDYPIILTDTEKTEFEVIKEIEAKQYLAEKGGASK